MTAGATFAVDVEDEDPTANEPMFGCFYTPLPVPAIRAYVVICESASGSPAGPGSWISYHFEPL